MSITCRCGAVNPDGTQFCSSCGAVLSQPQPQPQPVPYYQMPIIQQGERPISVMGWIGYLILFSIPLVNIITWIVVLCASQNKTLKHFIVAQIVMFVIAIIICLFISILGGSALRDSVMNSYY